MDPPPGYRRLPDPRPFPGTNLRIEAATPTPTDVWISFEAAVAEDLGRPFPFLIVRVDPYEGLPVRLEEVYPEVTEAFRRRLSTWADRMVREALAALAAKVESQVQP